MRKKYLIYIIGGLLVVVATVLLVRALFYIRKISQFSSEDEVILYSNSSTDSLGGGEERNIGEWIVDIGGAVKNPGVYTVSMNSRIHEVVNKAGGF